MAIEYAARIIEGSGREQLVDAEEVELWTDRTGKALKKQPARIVDYGDCLVEEKPKPLLVGGLFLGGGEWVVRRWRFRRERFYPARGESYVEPFAKVLRLPSMTPGGSAVWDKTHYHEDPADLLEEVEKAFQRLAAQTDELSSSKPALGKPSERLVRIEEIPFAIARQKAKKADWMD